MHVKLERNPVLANQSDVLLGEVLVVSARARQGRATLVDQLCAVGFDVTSLSDADTAWIHMKAWRHIRTEVPRVVVIDASPLCSGGRIVLARLASWTRRPQLPLVVLAGAAPLNAVVPGMVLFPLPCRCQQVTMRVLRASGVSENRCQDILLSQRFWDSDGADAWLPGSWRDEEEHAEVVRSRLGRKSTFVDVPVTVGNGSAGTSS